MRFRQPSLAHLSFSFLLFFLLFFSFVLLFFFLRTFSSSSFLSLFLSYISSITFLCPFQFKVGNTPCCRVTEGEGDFCPAREKQKNCTACAVEQNSLQRPVATDFEKYLPFFLKVTIFIVIIYVILIAEYRNLRVHF